MDCHNAPYTWRWNASCRETPAFICNSFRYDAMRIGHRRTSQTWHRASTSSLSRVQLSFLVRQSKKHHLIPIEFTLNSARNDTDLVLVGK